MGYRLSKIYTRTGDKGTTGLGDGTRINKDHIRIETMGTAQKQRSSQRQLVAELSQVFRQHAQIIFR